VVFLNGTVLPLSGKSESVNECAHTDLQKKFHMLGVCQKCRWIN